MSSKLTTRKMENNSGAPMGYFLGELGMVLRYLVEGDSYIIRPDLKPLAKKLKREFMAKRAIEEIINELSNEEPNQNKLRVLKMKLEPIYNNLKGGN